MQFPDFSDKFDADVHSPFTDDWSLQMQSSETKPRLKSSNMLLSLSNNLMAYQNSFKKNLPHPQLHCPKTSNPDQKKNLKRKLNFSSGLEQNLYSQHRHQQQFDKQNKIQRMNVQEAKANPCNDSGSNLIKLEKMFKIMKDFNTLNESILPFKVNLNKVSHKRILAYMAFKQFSVQNNKTTLSQKPMSKEQERRHNLEDGKNTIETQLLPIKRRIYSLDVREKENIRKRKFNKMEPKCINSNIFTLQKEEAKEGEKKNVFSRRKRTYSVRKPSNLIFEKSIEQIRSNYSRTSHKVEDKIVEQVEMKCSKDKVCQKIKEDKQRMEWDYFSDSRFFIENVNALKRQGLSEVNIVERNNRMNK